MPLIPPKLDDRDFETLFREARTRIPRYVPEWTDWNESDPGITLLQLQTWLAETILHRLNLLPDLNYIKFLQLLGVEQRPARPAQADLTFILKEKTVPTDVLINQGIIIGVSSRDLEEPLSFETDRAFRAISARLARVLLVPDVTSETTQDITQDNNAGGRSFAPFGDPAALGAALVLGFESKLPFSSEEIGLQFYLADEGRALLARPQEVLCGRPLEDENAPDLAWEWWDGTDWDSLDVTGDETRSLTQSGQVFFRVPGQIPAVQPSAAGLQSEPDETLLYWLRVRLAGGTYAAAPRIERVLTNTVRATAALTVRDEAVGSSDGTPNQVMTLRHTPVLADPVLVLEVDEGGGPQPWTEVSDFFGSTPDDPHYTLNRSTGQITFGDGRRGRIPVAGQFNVIARKYRYGGGLIGNVGTETINQLITIVPQAEEVTNFRPAEGGMDEESLDDTRLRGPRDVLKTRNRAVTLEDFEQLALQTEGAQIARARAYTSETDEGGHFINVVIVPQSSDPKPVPSEVSKRLVCKYLDERRLITTRVRVLGPLYHDMDVQVELTVMDDADLKNVKNAVHQRLEDYFHPMHGGRYGKGWQFGRDLYYSEVLHEIMRIEGVLRVDDFVVKKFLPRPLGTGNPQSLPYYQTPAAAQGALAGLVAPEEAASSCSVVEGEVVAVVQLGPPPENTPETQYYAAAVYSCCDMPVAEGALLALHRLDISVNYLR